MNALDYVTLPRVSEETDFRKRQTESVNERRLNQNFKMIEAELVDKENEMSILEDKILKKVIFPKDYITKKESDGTWTWHKYKEGSIHAWNEPITVSKNCDSSSGSLFCVNADINLPSNLFTSVTTVLASASSSDDIFINVKSYSKTKVTVQIFCTTLKLVTVEIHLDIYGS